MDPMFPRVESAGRDESARLDALRRYDVAGTPPEPAFDDLATLAAQLCATPIALVSFVASDREWFKARTGMARDAVPRDIAFGAHAILQSGLFVVPDASTTRASPAIRS